MKLVALADEKGAMFWKARGMMYPRLRIGLDRQSLRRSSNDHLRNHRVAINRSNMWVPLYLSSLARAHADLGQFDDAWRCIDEAMTAVENN